MKAEFIEITRWFSTIVTDAQAPCATWVSATMAFIVQDKWQSLQLIWRDKILRQPSKLRNVIIELTWAFELEKENFTKWKRPNWVLICHCLWSHTYITQAPFLNFAMKGIFDFAKVFVGLFELCSYLTGITAAKLWRYFLNTNVICHR